jgi:hypothetical protein
MVGKRTKEYSHCRFRMECYKDYPNVPADWSVLHHPANCPFKSNAKRIKRTPTAAEKKATVAKYYEPRTPERKE